MWLGPRSGGKNEAELTLKAEVSVSVRTDRHYSWHSGSAPSRLQNILTYSRLNKKNLWLVSELWGRDTPTQVDYITQAEMPL